MKRKILFLVCLSVISVALIVTVSNKKSEEVTKLKEQNRILAAENQQLKIESSYEPGLLELDLPSDYRDWAHIEEIANRMVSDSNGRFKKTWAIYLVNQADHFDIDPFLVYELLKVETGHTFNPEMIGPETKYGHAYGMSQFMKNTAPWIADMAGLPYSDELLFDPYYSIQLAFVYLDFLHHQYQDWDEALTAYHRGMTGMEDYKNRTGTARSLYAEVIQTNAEKHQKLALLN